ncbi:putative uncharacterized protein [Blautia hydrogenotrophica CAG:147]|uniref:bifunctional enoyl-CoA hydratase/phosphate acetyltransferase n=1 Tax=Blautia hydrogenotrophica TaxID=53443 RepID=UPI00033EC6D9|nr:bifunctional enoyl-CoA hydratase/phosphate acetyltransferase [Blautia hydrogenotrophica]CCX59279.1 putative uncharacterized protein [Blautia hydrogenotrophica CAG:147]
MVYKKFEELLALVDTKADKKTVALVRAEDDHALEAVAEVVKKGLIDAVLVGNREAIKKTAEKIGFSVTDDQIVDAEDSESAAAEGVKLIREGRADFLMKGKLETSQMLRPVVNKQTGLNKGGVMSHVSLTEVPAYHKMVLTTDGGMLPYPTLEQKKHIIENAVYVMNRLGYEEPKVCVLAASETPNPKMPESMEAAALKEMNQKGEIENCIVEGPISFDLAMVKEKAEIKGYESPCAGDADILIVPNIHAGNILGKCLIEMANSKMAGLIVGAQCPIVLTSRGASSEEKFNSLMLACIVSGK